MDLEKAIIVRWRIHLDGDETDILTGMYGGSKKVNCSRRFSNRGTDHRFTIHHDPDTAFQECREKGGLGCDSDKLSKTVERFLAIGLIEIVQEEAGKDKNRDCYSVSGIENYHICELKGSRAKINVTPDQLQLIKSIMDKNFCSPLSGWMKRDFPRISYWFLRRTVIDKWQLLSAPPNKKRGPYTVTHSLFPPAEFTAEKAIQTWDIPTTLGEADDLLRMLHNNLLVMQKQEPANDETLKSIQSLQYVTAQIAELLRSKEREILAQKLAEIEERQKLMRTEADTLKKRIQELN